jgi:hypothetical protein
MGCLFLRNILIYKSQSALCPYLAKRFFHQRSERLSIGEVIGNLLSYEQPISA